MADNLNRDWSIPPSGWKPSANDDAAAPVTKNSSSTAKDWSVPPVGWTAPTAPAQPQQSTLEKLGNTVQDYINTPVEQTIKDAEDMGLGLTQGVANIAPGTANLGIHAYNGLTGNNVKPYQKFDFAPNNLNASFGQQIPAFLMPELKMGKLGEALENLKYGGKLAKSLITKGAPVSAYEATQSDDPLKAGAETFGAVTPFNVLSHLVSSTNPLVGLGARLAGTAIGGYTGYQGAKALGADSFKADALGALTGALMGGIQGNTENIARDKMLTGVNADTAKAKLAAAKRLGLTYMTPGEAGGNPFVAGAQGSVGKTSEGAQLYFDKGMQRQKSESDAIENLYKTIYDPIKLDPIKEALYKSAYQKEVPQNILDSFQDDKVYQKAEKNMLSSPAYQESLKDVPKNSIEYQDRVKQSLDDMAESAPKKEARIINKTNKKLVNSMDTVAPEYANARALAERQLTLSNGENGIQDKLKDENMTGRNFYNKVLKNPKNFAKLQFSLRNVPDAQQQLNDMKEVFPHLINTPTNLTYHGYTKNGMDQSRNSKKDLLQTIKEAMSGHTLDQKSVELMTSPNWISQLPNVGKISNLREKISKGSNLLGRVSGALTGQANSSKSNKKLLHLDMNNFAGYQK